MKQVILKKVLIIMAISFLQSLGFGQSISEKQNLDLLNNMRKQKIKRENVIKQDLPNKDKALLAGIHERMNHFFVQEQINQKKIQTCQQLVKESKSNFVDGVFYFYNNDILENQPRNCNLGQEMDKVRGINGYLDSVTEKPNYIFVRGWACQKSLEESISVHIYVRRPDGKGQVKIAQGVAEKSNEPGVQKACGTTGSHRFNIAIPKSKSNSFKGQPINVYGITKIKKYPNALIKRSGRFSVPGQVKGHKSFWNFGNLSRDR